MTRTASGGTGTRPHLAVAACARFPDLHDDWPLLRAALADVGVGATTAVWNDPAVDWAAFDLVLASGAWDNIHHVGEFLAWADRVAASGVPVRNSPATLRWNIDKHYLRDLERAGVPTVPTVWVEPGTSDADVRALALPEGEVVVKPSVSGGGYRTARYQPHEHAAARAHVRELTAAGRTAMVQPYEARVDSEGETALIYIGSAFSHAVHKDPMIRRGVGPTDSLIENQVVTGATATAAAAPRRRGGSGRGRAHPRPAHLRPGRPRRNVARRGRRCWNSSSSTRCSSSSATPKGRCCWPPSWPGCWQPVRPVRRLRRAPQPAPRVRQKPQPQLELQPRPEVETRRSRPAGASAPPSSVVGGTTWVPASSAKSAQAAWASVSGVNSPSA